jgi:hypothetical protein
MDLFQAVKTSISVPIESLSVALRGERAWANWSAPESSAGTRDLTLDKTGFGFNPTRHPDKLLLPRPEYSLVCGAKLTGTAPDDLAPYWAAITVDTGADFSNWHFRTRSKYPDLGGTLISKLQTL